MIIMQIFLMFCTSFSKIKDSFLPFTQYCKAYGYPVQTHQFKGKDGFPLTYFRIRKKGGSFNEQAKPVLMHHGLLDSSDTFVVNQQNKAPAFILANNGYDVWIGNSRGNRYSYHKNWWNFSYMQMAQQDLPAAFEYINNKTLQKIDYVGHSQGTTIMFAALSLRIQSIINNINKFIALGPVTYIQHNTSPLISGNSSAKLAKILSQLKVKQFMPYTKQSSYILSKICKGALYICKQSLLLLSDDDPNLVSLNRMPTIMGHFPAGTSLMNMLHWSQMNQVPIFRRFDYGPQRNMKEYGTKQAPRYQLQKIQETVHLFVGQEDRLADVKDANRLFTELSNSKNKSMQLIKIGHAGLIWGKDMSYFQKVLSILKA